MAEAPRLGQILRGSVLIDICLVAGRRPDLVARTLRSFDDGLFRHFRIGKFIANVDPIFGDADAHNETLDVIRSYFPDADIAEPQVPGFCRAVQRNWLHSEAPILLHLEDDWLLHREIKPEWLATMFRPRRVAQVVFDNAYLLWGEKSRGEYRYRRIPRSLFGYPIRRLKRRIPAFTTSPSFLEGDFARTAATLMKAEYDPEKQFFSGVNPELQSFAFRYRCRVFSPADGYPVSDIGREWRESRRIEKITVGAVSTWSSET